MPLRRHEEVIVYTSAKPLEQLASHKERSCPYCMESFDISKHHRHAHADGYSTDRDHRSYKKNGKMSKYRAKDCEERGASRYDDFGLEYKVPKQKLKTEYEPKFREKKYRKELQKEDARKITDYAQAYPKRLHLDETVYKNRDCCVEKSKHTIDSNELQELCIHALVHRTSASGCKCRNCVELQTDKEDRRKLVSYLTSGKQNYARRVKSDEGITEDGLHRTEKGAYALRETKDAKAERKGKGNEAHILTRILSNESVCDTDLSELSSGGVLIKSTKFISAEDYKRKKEKLKKEFLKQYVSIFFLEYMVQ